MEKNYFVIGSPVSHSLSPTIFEKLFEIHKIEDCTYSYCDVTEETLPGFIGSIDKRNICGFNVTMPLKKSVLQFLDKPDESAKFGANTIVVQDGQLLGYSTDAKGFFRALENTGTSIKNSHIVLIGAGAVTAALADHAVNTYGCHVTIVNRTIENAQKIQKSVEAHVDTLSNLDQYLPGCDILINSTPLGMAGLASDFEDFSFLGLLPPSACVCDLIYNPRQTNLLKRAEALSLKTMGGLPMLIWQAFFSFEKYFGILPGKSDYSKVLEIIDQANA